MSCSFGDSDAAYVLGALSPAERLAYERTWTRCADCTRSVRQLAGLPGLLARVDPAVLEEPGDMVPVPDAVLTNLVARGTPDTAPPRPAPPPGWPPRRSWRSPR